MHLIRLSDCTAILRCSDAGDFHMAAWASKSAHTRLLELKMTSEDASGCDSRANFEVPSEIMRRGESGAGDEAAVALTTIWRA